MLNEVFEGKISSVSAAIKKIKNDEGVRETAAICKFRIETDDVDYESLANFDSSISATLLNIQPMPFKGVDFGDKSIMNLTISFYLIEDRNATQTEVANAVYKNVKIKDLRVKNKMNVPYYIFSLEMPMDSTASFLFNNIKTFINFKFEKE